MLPRGSEAVEACACAARHDGPCQAAPSLAPRCRPSSLLRTLRLHFFDYQAADREWYSVWGLTAAMLIEIASKGFGREPDFEALPRGYVPMHADMFEDRPQAGQSG